MAYSYNRYIGDGNVSQFAVSFTLGFLNRSDVYASINGTPTTFVWINDGLIDLDTTPPNGSTVLIRRIVDVSVLIHDYEDGAVVIEKNLDDSNLQGLMAAHQVLDGFLDSGINADQDFNMYRAINLADGIDPQDAVTLKQLYDITNSGQDIETWWQETLAARDEAVPAAAAATQAASDASSAKDACENYETSCHTHAVNAENSATSADTDASAAGTAAASATASESICTTAKNDATTAASQALSSKNAAASSAGQASTYATNASNSATTATNASSAANTYAQSASSSETNASTSASNAAGYRTQAASSAGQSASSASASDASAILAQKYAENPEDTLVAPGEYSALHWANKAMNAASAASPLNTRRNLLINASFAIWTRGTSFACSDTTQYTSDRWIYNHNTVDDTVTKTVEQVYADIPGYRPAWALQVTSDAALLNGDDSSIGQIFEQPIGTDSTEADRPVTVSYWCKCVSHINRQLAVRLGTASEYTIHTISDQWVRYSCTFTASSGTDLQFRFPADGAVLDFVFAHVQVEFGDVPTEYEDVPTFIVNKECARFYQLVYIPTVNLILYAPNGDTRSNAFCFPVPMRVAPVASITPVTGCIFSTCDSEDTSQTPEYTWLITGSTTITYEVVLSGSFDTTSSADVATVGIRGSWYVFFDAEMYP